MPRYSPESLKKAELEVALDEHIAQNTARFSSKPELSGYFNSRSKAFGSPVKKETAVKDEIADKGEKAEKAVKVTKRRANKAVDDVIEG